MISDKIQTTLLIAAMAADSAMALIGDWRSMTYLDSVTVLAAHEGQLFAGTTGGIRLIQPQGLQERVYNNSNEGIRDVSIMGITPASDNSLWAVSRSGIIYQYRSSGSWRYFDRNLASLGWYVNPRAFASADKYLLLGTEKGLSFFNRQTGLVDFNPDIFDRTQSVAVTALLVREQFLYVATSVGIFRAKIYWEAPDNPPQNEYLDILNPQIWEKVDTATTAGHLYWGSSGLEHLPSGTTIEEPFPVQVTPNRPLKFQNESIGIPIDMHAAAVVDNRIFVGGRKGLFYWDNGGLKSVRNPAGLPEGNPANVRSSQSGTYLWVLNTWLYPYLSQLYRLEGKKWNKIPGFSFSQYLEPIGY